MAPHLYWLLLTITCGYSLWKGRSDERMAATVCIVASVVSVLVLSPLAKRYSGVETGELTVDLLVLAAFTYIALRSERFWPLWIAGLQLTASMAHILKSIEIGLMPEAYAAATRIWSYPILLIIAVGAWRNHKRHQVREPTAA
ncbi:MAG TPA: hypothetical protein VGE68_10005 [Sphingomicrobium sp.]